MKKIKKIVLSVLLLAFTFILLHDYVILDAQSSCSYELVHLECENNSVDLTSHIHDSIHSLVLDPLVQIVSIALLSPYQQQFEVRNFFISHINSVPHRPPLV